MNAAEKARLAKEKQRKLKAKKLNGIKEFFGSFDPQFLVVLIGTIISAILIVLCLIFEISGLISISASALSTLKVFFWINVGVVGLEILLVILSIVFYNDLYEDSYIATGWINAVLAVGMIAMGIVTLSSGKFGIISYYEDTENGVVYAEYSDGYEVCGFTGEVEDVVIYGEINNYYVKGVNKSAFKNNDYIKNLSFVGGDLTIEKSAFEHCRNLQTVTFDGYTYNVGAEAFADCASLKEFNVGSAHIIVDNWTHSIDSWSENEIYSYYEDTTIFGGLTNATISINGGKLKNISDDVALYKIGNNVELVSAILIFEEIEYTFNKTMVFENGFDFAGSTLINEPFKYGGFVHNPTFYPVAYNLYIPASVTLIPNYLFGDEMRGSEIKVFYAGDQASWESLTVGSLGNGNYDNGKVNVTYDTSYAA